MGSSSSFDLSSYLTSTLLQPRAPQVGVVNKIKLVGAFNEKTHANVVLLDLGVRDLEDLKALKQVCGAPVNSSWARRLRS